MGNPRNGKQAYTKEYARSNNGQGKYTNAHEYTIVDIPYKGVS